jgi:hypothetical protein
MRLVPEYYSVPIGVADLQAAAAASTVGIPYTLPTPLTVKAGRLVRLVGGWLEVAFTRAAAVGATTPQTLTAISVGDVNSPNRFLGPFDVNLTGNPVPTVPGGIQPAANVAPVIYNVDTAITLTIAAQAAKDIADLDTGQLWLLFELLDLKGGIGSNADGDS